MIHKWGSHGECIYLSLNHLVPVLVHLLYCAIDVNGVGVVGKLLKDAVHGNIDSSTTHSSTAKEVWKLCHTVSICRLRWMSYHCNIDNVTNW